MTENRDDRPVAATPGALPGLLDGEEPAEVASLLREVLGDPWRPRILPGLEERCPTCDSPDPARHPAAQFEGEVQVCCDPWHGYGRKCPWLTPTVLGIARRAYDESDFAALPVLADALEEAGCDSEDLLRHLRGQERSPDDKWHVCRRCKKLYRHTNKYSDCGSPGCEGEEYDVAEWIPLRGPHVRGCWALDLILG